MRESGILLHITSLPSPYGIGDFGRGAYDFADFLISTKQKIWQLLPLNPTDPATGNSPYSSCSAFAVNTLFISPLMLYEKCLLTKADIESAPVFDSGHVDYEKAASFKKELLKRAYLKFKVTGIDADIYAEFCNKNSKWLEDYALFTVIKRTYGGAVWNTWEKGLKDRDQQSLNDFRDKNKDEIETEKYLQFLAFDQWEHLKRYCNARQVQIFGDIPIYVSYDSADVWTNPGIFKLKDDLEPEYVAGVPPDYFSKTGQYWGNPVYDWDKLRNTKFSWWVDRLRQNLSLFDIVRIDHFRGLVGYWQIPASESTAVNGHWEKVPAHEFFDSLRSKFGYLPIIAEDLGFLTQDVKDVMKHYRFPGMKILLFAFSEDLIKHPYLPHNYDENCVVYTGTHDNNTAKGWFDNEAKHEDRERFFEYIGKRVSSEDVPFELIVLAMASIADKVILPMQDILGLGEEARMNLPGTANGNWAWRMKKEDITQDIRTFLVDVTIASERD